MQIPPELPQISEKEQEELKKKFNKIKQKLDQLKKELKTKYKEKLIAISLLPPELPKPQIPNMPQLQKKNQTRTK